MDAGRRVVASAFIHLVVARRGLEEGALRKDLPFVVRALDSGLRMGIIEVPERKHEIRVSLRNLVRRRQRLDRVAPIARGREGERVGGAFRGGGAERRLAED